MPRRLAFFLTIVAVFPFRLAAATTTMHDAPIAPQVAELAARLDIDPAHDRVRFMAEMARLLYSSPDARPPLLRPTKSDAAVASPRVTVLVPLTPELWGRIIFHRVVPPDQMIGMILADRRAAFLCRGLSALDDETLTYLAEHPTFLTMLYERAAPVFAAFGDNLRIHGQRVVPPGGDQAVPVWESVTREPVTSPEAFARVLFGEYEGRLAYLYDVIASAETPAAAFALGLWMADGPQRTQRFQALLDASIHGYREWRELEHPFSRPLGDLAVLLMRVPVEPSGAPRAPADRAFWARALEADANATFSGDRSAGEPTQIDAAWLVAATSEHDMYQRIDRADAVSFGFRVFDAVDGSSGPVAADVVRQFRRFRMLLLTFERLGVRAPATYRDAIERGESVVSGPLARRFWPLSEFEGALALLVRMHRSGTLSTAEASALAASLVAVQVHDGQYSGRMAQWIRTDLARRLPAGDTWEDRAIHGLAGPTAEKTGVRLFWEGQTYRVDLALAEQQRMEIVRRKQGGHTLDLALAVDDAARALRAESISLERIHDVSQALSVLVQESGARLKNPAVSLPPPGAEPPRDSLDWIVGARQELARLTKPSDARRAARVGESLRELSDIMLGNALLSLAYAADLGDPEGAALLAGNVALRHDFGLGRKDGDTRDRMPWALPRQDFQPGVPWHIGGAILGLDVPLAPLNLRRLELDRLADAPKISSIEREALAVGVSLMDPLRLKDADRDAIAGAIARGRTRIQELQAGRESIAAVADLLGFDGWRTRELMLSLSGSPFPVGARFSLVDLITLGGGAGRADLDAWGTPAMYSTGCLCTRFPGVRAWRTLEGRPQLPMMAATMGDLNLAVAVMLHDLDLPANLARSVLSVGMQDFIDELALETTNDWWSLSRQAQRLKRQRVEDYVSAAAAVNGPLVPEDPAASHEP